MEMQDTDKKLVQEFNPLAQKYVQEQLPAAALLIAFAADFDIRAETEEEKTALAGALFDASTQRLKKAIDSGGYSSASGSEVALLLQTLEDEKIRAYLPERAPQALADLSVQAVQKIAKEKDNYSYGGRSNNDAQKNLTELAKMALDYARKFGAAAPKKPDAVLSAKHLAA